MKRQLSVLVAAALALSMAACSTSPSTSASSAASGTVISAESSEYSLTGATAFAFTDSGITTTEGDYDGYKVEGTTLTINAAGTYVVSGSCADGNIKIKAETEGVILVLNGLDLTSTTTAPIVCGKSTTVTIVAQDGTENTLTDTTANNKDADGASEDAENAVLKCKDGSQVILCGTGTLNIHAVGKNGIKSGTENEGREASLTIRELTLNIDAPENDAINAEQTLNVESGTLNISAGDDAVHCDYTLNIGAEGTAGPVINISTCYEGLEGAELNIYSGTIDITATDDCLNAANGDLTDYAFSMNISGGTITAYTSGGDGFDSNGTMTISGGTISVWTANTADNEPLDADGTITISGGTVLAAGGSAGMGYTIQADQPCVVYGGSADSSISLTKDSAFTLTDADGNTVYSGTAVCNASFVIYSSADLAADSDYTLSTGDTQLGSATAQTGTLTASFGGMGGPGNGNGAPNGMTPPDGTAQAPTDGQTTPSGKPGQRPDNQNGTPPEKPSGDTTGTPPQQDAASQETTTTA